MLQATTADEAIARNRVQRDDKGATATDFIGARGVVSRDSLAFLVYNPPHYETPAHYHDVNQFQLVVQGSAFFGKHRVKVGSVHYAEHGTPYGPIMPEDHGLSYFTLRQTSPGGYFIMPGAKAGMNRKTGRTKMADASTALTGFTGMSELFRVDDGLSAYETAASAGDPLPLPEIDHGGAFIVIMAGQAIMDGRAYPERSCISVAAGDPLPLLTAGPKGAAAIFMTFPRLPAGNA
ncbi:MAG TPA: hypothetical protein VKZ79_05385 [Alphaproteobacteria bacterium]|nr:hypothetical protein [Alphaproteobacteria bacterium]